MIRRNLCPLAATFCFALAACLLLCTAALPGELLLLHVAPNGDDTWSGRPAAPNSGRTDGPLASLAGARDAIRRLRASDAAGLGPVTVRVHGGVYRLAAPFRLEPQDSGTAEALVVFEAADNDRPVLSGGRAITGFQENGPLWEVEIPQVKAGQWHFRQLFVNGQRRQLARSPNSAYHRIAALVPGPARPNTKAVAQDRFIFAPGDIKPWDRLGDAYIVLMHSWETSIHPIKSISEGESTVHFTAPLKEWWSIGHWEDSQRYYAENARELLDQPGEWYLNRETGVLSYWRMRGEKLGETEVVAPVLTELVRFAGNADKGQFVRHITLRSLAFHHADWVLDPKGNSSTQAAVEVPAAVMADGALNCAIERCEVAHIGGYGIWFRRGCKNDRIQQNRLFDLGAGGIRVGEATMARTDVAESSRTLVDNNHIFDGGHVYAGAVGVWVAQSSHNHISHNDIHDLRYTGISVGWNWGLEANRTHHNVIEFNHVHNLGQGVLSDAGLIYCLGVSPGCVIRNNIFHDMWPYSQPAFGWGIYLDAQCGQYLVENNLVYNTLSGGLMFNNGGHAHTIRNNIFALSANHALWPYSEKRPSTFRRNIVYLTQGELLIPYGERSLNERLAAKESPGDWDENLFWHTDGPEQLRFYRRSFAEWQAIGLDGNSRIADPQFMDTAAHDFRLKPSSPALQLGFQPFAISGVGLYGDPAWVAESRHADCPPRPQGTSPDLGAHEFEKEQPKAVPAQGPLRVHPMNPRYFTDGSGKVVLLTGSHTWGNLQDYRYATLASPPPMDFPAYLAFLKRHHHNFFRLWAWETAFNPNAKQSTISYDPMPYQRPGSGVALDGKPKFDLSLFNAAYFDRLRARAMAARDRGIHVSVMLFNGFSIECKGNVGGDPWQGHPFNPNNNINAVDGGGSRTIHTLANPVITAQQEAYVQKVIDTVNDLDNVLYEITNEDSGSPAGVAWQIHMIRFIKKYEATKAKQHPVGMTACWPEGSDAMLLASPADWISPTAQLPLSDGRKVILNDTDHSYFWTGLKADEPAAQRAWVWKNFTRGNQCLFMDPYLDPSHDPGRNNTAGGQPDSYWDTLREAMGQTRMCAERMNLATMVPHGELSSTEFCLAHPGKEYLVYQPKAGAAFTVQLEAGNHQYEVFNPAQGETAGIGQVDALGAANQFKPPFDGDAVLYIQKK